jgi:hypothetical protein
METVLHVKAAARRLTSMMLSAMLGLHQKREGAEKRNKRNFGDASETDVCF